MQLEMQKMVEIYPRLDSCFTRKEFTMMSVYLVNKSQENISSIQILIMELLGQLFRRSQGLDSIFMRGIIY